MMNHEIKQLFFRLELSDNKLFLDHYEIRQVIFRQQ